MEISIDQIAAILGGKVEGNGTVMINDVAKIQEGRTGTISFLANMKYEEFLYTTAASAVIVSEGFVPKKEVSAALIYVKDAYSAFTQLLKEYEKMITPKKSGIESPVFIDDSAQIGEGEYIGAFAYIGKGVKIGKNVKIYPHVYIGDNVEIGDDVTLFAGAKVNHGCKIGNHCTLQAGAVIGSEGFGFAPQEDGTYSTIPQLGRVVLEDHVDIGANTTIDRATIGDTLIREGVKLDNLIQIGHNVVIGKHTVMAAQVGVAGSSEVGEHCMLGGQVGLAGHLKVADKVMLAAQTGVPNDIEQEGAKMMGYPAISSTSFIRSHMVFTKLPELLQRIRKLEKKLKEL
ncbi:UDP-3-O-(3-hydroxymyristoyl)glucosamine N-acyltransferase [Algivirga pacifica]|uniref:UDP-3-O-acylglucosamine N-acyltransferase n=1 Tax=Algivirga pacifica TaxID=1162670 RepID=A0ABP9DK72_9BACT